jgi:FKBP-type peptidyl-prolyl cis-trans isomerase
MCISIEDICSGSFDDLASSYTELLTKDGGVRKKTIKSGDGNKILVGSNVWVHYITFAEGNDEPIDSTRDKQSLARFTLGSGEMIHGFEIGLKSMSLGEVANFLLEPDYAYGRLGCPDLIPPSEHKDFSYFILSMDLKQ